MVRAARKAAIGSLAEHGRNAASDKPCSVRVFRSGTIWAEFGTPFKRWVPKITGHK